MLRDAVTGLRTLVVLVGVALLLVLAGAWGWHEMTRPLPGKADAAVCTDTTVHAHEHVFPAQVVVTVLNASKREGLAGRTSSALTDEGFTAASSGNAPRNASVKRAQIWTSDPSNPAVRLVASWLHKPTIVKRPTTLPGVVVVVGQGFSKVSGGVKQVTAAKDTTICSPPVD